MAARSAAGRASPAAWLQPSRSAYRAKKRYVFRRVSKNFRPTSSIPSGSHRFGSHGLLDESRYQRITSAPWREMASHGSTTLPRDFDIFWPLASRMRSLTTTSR